MKEEKLGIKMKNMKEYLKGKSLVAAHQFSEGPNLQHQSSLRITSEEAKTQTKTTTRHSNKRIFTPLIESPSVLLAKLLDAKLVRKIPFHQPSQAPKNFNSNVWCVYHFNAIGHYTDRCW